jgi:hypothetical protein
MPLRQKGSIPRRNYTKLYPNKHACFVHRLFPAGDPTHANLDALMPEGQHTSALLHKGLTAPLAADAQPQTSPGPEVLQALSNAGVYSRLLAVIKPYAEEQKWDVWAEEEDSSMTTEEDAQVLLQRTLCFCMNVSGSMAANVQTWAHQCRPQNASCTLHVEWHCCC